MVTMTTMVTAPMMETMTIMVTVTTMLTVQMTVVIKHNIAFLSKKEKKNFNNAHIYYHVYQCESSFFLLSSCRRFGGIKMEIEMYYVAMLTVRTMVKVTTMLTMTTMVTMSIMVTVPTMVTKTTMLTATTMVIVQMTMVTMHNVACVSITEKKKFNNAHIYYHVNQFDSYISCFIVVLS